MTVAVGLSGGVDSAVAARRLLAEGHTVVGLAMTLGRANDAADGARARAVARTLGIAFETVDFAEAWRGNVLGDVAAAYRAGETPNPCVRCNETVKLGLLPRHAFERLGCDRFATGHYARLEGGHLLRGVDRAKDQSYFLYRVAPEILARTLFPLGVSTKAEIRSEARAAGFVAADTSDSQDFCGGDVRAYAGLAPCPGRFTTADGRTLGRHDGCWRYTPGQRKGLGLGGGGTPLYVLRVEMAQNEVVVGTRDEAVSTTFGVRCITPNLAARLTKGPLASVAVKVRSQGEPRGPVTVAADGEGCARVTCPDGILGLAPGQSAVFYAGEEVLGGGFIEGPDVV